MKKVFILMLCLLAVFAIVSCKHEPEKSNEPEPAPAPVDDDATVYVLTATAAGDRFQFKWDSFVIEGGEVVTFQFQCEKALSTYTTRSIAPDEKYASSVSYSGEAENGWYTFTYTIPEGKTATGFGVSLFVSGGVVIGDVMKIKNITIDDEEMTLEQANAWAGCSPTITVEE